MDLYENSGSALPHQQQLPLLEQQGPLLFLGYQPLEQCMAYLNLQLAILFISRWYVTKEQLKWWSSGIHTLYKNTATRFNYCDSIPLVNFIMWGTRKCNITLLTPWFCIIHILGMWIWFQVLPVWLNREIPQNPTYTNYKQGKGMYPLEVLLLSLNIPKKRIFHIIEPIFI